MSDNEGTDIQQIQAKVSFAIPDFMPSLYAHHMMLQEDESDIILSFFEIQTPFIPAKGEERQVAIERYEKEGIKAHCVVKLRIAKHRLPSFAQLLSERVNKLAEEMKLLGEKYGVNTTDENKN